MGAKIHPGPGDRQGTVPPVERAETPLLRRETMERFAGGRVEARVQLESVSRYVEAQSLEWVLEKAETLATAPDAPEEFEERIELVVEGDLKEAVQELQGAVKEAFGLPREGKPSAEQRAQAGALLTKLLAHADKQEQDDLIQTLHERRFAEIAGDGKTGEQEDRLAAVGEAIIEEIDANAALSVKLARLVAKSDVIPAFAKSLVAEPLREFDQAFGLLKGLVAREFVRRQIDPRQGEDLSAILRKQYEEHCEEVKRRIRRESLDSEPAAVFKEKERSTEEKPGVLPAVRISDDNRPALYDEVEELRKEKKLLFDDSVAALSQARRKEAESRKAYQEQEIIDREHKKQELIEELKRQMPEMLDTALGEKLAQQALRGAVSPQEFEELARMRRRRAA